jgi:hypothetical protein
VTEAFPFTHEEWRAVNEAARVIVEAGFMEDPVLEASRLAALREVLTALRSKYPDHPVLLETEADFADDATEKQSLYEQSIDTALQRGLPTLSARLSLAEMLLEQTDDVEGASRELVACTAELKDADASERQQWRQLCARAGLSVGGENR